MESKPRNFSWLDVPKSIWYFIAEDKKKFLTALSVVSTIYLYDLVPPYVLGKIVDFFTNYEMGESLRPFYLLVIFISVSWILAAFIRLKSKNILGISRQHARARARIWGFERLTEFSLEWHQKENTGNKLQRIFTGSDSVSNWIRLAQKDLIKIFINTFAVIIFFSFVNWKFVTIVVVHVSLFFAIGLIFSKKIYALNNEFNRLNQTAGGTYVEGATNILAIKALGGEAGMISSVANRETLSRDISIQRINTSNLKWRIFQTLSGISWGFFLLSLGSAVVNQLITVGMILVFYSYFERLQRYLADMDEIYTDMLELKSDLGNMMPIFKETEFIKRGNETFPYDWNKIELKNAVMDYGSGQMGLQDFNLTLNRGTKTGVAGLSGSGKSTLAKIILGLYALKSGEFKVGGKNYYSISHNETLSNITVVLQETELFNLSLRDNITMMREGDEKLLKQAIEISQIKPVIDKLPQGLDALIGEKGYMLSGGERQRLGIARAIYKNSPIIILDEATSSLDSETEGRIMERLLGEYGMNKTFLIIAHRLGTLKYTDNIAVMEAGRVVEEGSYYNLMNNSKSVFFRMNNSVSANSPE